MRRLLFLAVVVGAVSAEPQVPCTDNCTDLTSEFVHASRRLAVITVTPSDNLQTVLNNANAGDEIVLADGTYTGSGTSASGSNMIYINKAITIRAENPGQVVLDGQNARRVLFIASGTVVLNGLNITRGSAGSVSPVCRLL